MCGYWWKCRISQIWAQRLPDKGRLGGPCLLKSSWKGTRRRICTSCMSSCASWGGEVVSSIGESPKPFRESSELMTFFCLARMWEIVCSRAHGGPIFKNEMILKGAQKSIRNASLFPHRGGVIYMWIGVPAWAGMSCSQNDFATEKQNNIKSIVKERSFFLWACKCQKACPCARERCFQVLPASCKCPGWPLFFLCHILFGKCYILITKMVPRVTPYPENLRLWTHNMTLVRTNGPQQYSKIVQI